jgi:uncharacterized membrane protein YqjE
MAEIEPHSPGLFGSVRKLLDTGLAALHTRVELFAVELEEEKVHIIEIFLWTTALLFSGMMAVIVLTAIVIMLFREEWRIYIAGAFCLVYLGGAIWCLFGLRARLKRPMPFSATIEEVKKDRDWLCK